MRDDRRITLLLLRLLCYIALAVLAWSVLSKLSLVLTPVAVAMVLAFLLDPSVRSLEERRVPRWLAVGLMLLALLGVLTGVVLTFPYLVRQEIERFAAQLPTYQALINTKLLPFLSKVFKFRASSINDWVRLISTQLVDWIRGAAGQISETLGSALLGVAGLFRYLIAVLLVPIFAVSFLMDMPSLTRSIRDMVPPRWQASSGEIVHDIQIALGGWLRGQLIVMMIQAALYSIGLSISGIPLAIVIGCTAGFLAFVPYVGVSIGLLAALLVSLLEISTRGAAPVLGVLVTFGSVQLLDAVVITPRAVGGRIGLSAVGVIFSLSLGGSLLGYAGLLLAVPFAAVLKAMLPRLIEAYQGTAFYRGRAAPGPAAPEGPPPPETAVPVPAPSPQPDPQHEDAT
jgi:predicted PurR-regulated permease PerM